ncbi:9121_t:CDS:2 [Funneliformis caledonium]|uniref:9121_t:CDS:1 n=1 Tax=Funneliformis caledonium TaxID=1117310 RepID=A0A9N9HNU6_9GLOM|nr:9121_t:CDS:2 [Funneliformis caledonium]
MPYIFIVQSLGYGKSRLIKEYARQGPTIEAANSCEITKNQGLKDINNDDLQGASNDFNDSDEETKNLISLAILASLYSIDISSFVHFFSNLIASHLGTYLIISQDKIKVLACYPPEPIITEAAYELLNNNILNYIKLTTFLDELLTNNIILRENNAEYNYLKNASVFFIRFVTISTIPQLDAYEKKIVEVDWGVTTRLNDQNPKPTIHYTIIDLKSFNITYRKNLKSFRAILKAYIIPYNAI